MKEQQKEGFSIEAAFEKLESTVNRLEQEDISLEESFRVYQSGMELLKQCNDAIDKVEKQVLVLQEDGDTHELS